MSTFKYYKNGQWNYVNGTITGDTVPIGAIIEYGTTTAPTGWLVCDGSYVSKTEYSELYSAIGDAFLNGGTAPSGKFRLPDLKGRVPVGYNSSDNDFKPIGKTGGEKKHLLILNELPSQTVSGYCADDKKSWATGAFGDYSSAAYPTNVVNASGRGTGDQPHNNLQPYQVVCYIIKAKQSAGVVAQVETSASNSNTNVYSCKYVNDTLSNLIKIKEVAGTTDGNGFLNLNMNLNQYIVLGIRVKIGQDSFANPYNIRGIDGWSVQLKTWDGQNIGSKQFTLEVVYIET